MLRASRGPEAIVERTNGLQWCRISHNANSEESEKLSQLATFPLAYLQTNPPPIPSSEDFHYLIQIGMHVDCRCILYLQI